MRVGERTCPLKKSQSLTRLPHSASVAVTVRMGYLMKFKSPDFLWDTLDVAIWSDIEQGLAITAGSLATLRPLYRDLTKRLLGWTDASAGTFPSDRKDSRKWYRTPSSEPQKRSGPFSLVSMTRGNGQSRRSAESDEELATSMDRPAIPKLRDDLVTPNEDDKGFNSWRIQLGDRSDEDLTVARGITRQTDVFLETTHDH